MATYDRIQEHVRKQRGCSVKTSWMAHTKELNGLQPRPTDNRASFPARQGFPARTPSTASPPPGTGRL